MTVLVSERIGFILFMIMKMIFICPIVLFEEVYITVMYKLG